MKFSTVCFGIALSSLSWAAPTPTVEVEERSIIEKRASISDAATVGYATLNGGTTGGKGGSTTTVSTLAQYTAAIAGDSPKVVIISGTITGAVQARPGSNTSIIGKNSSASMFPVTRPTWCKADFNPFSELVGIGMYINKVKNVIIRNLTIQKVLAENGDAIGIQASTNVWVGAPSLPPTSAKAANYSR